MLVINKSAKIIGYYETQEMAEFSLWNYNKNPVLFEEIQKLGTITFETIYQEWSSMKFRCISQNAINGYKARMPNVNPSGIASYQS